MTPADQLARRIHAGASPLKWERVRRGLTLRQVSDALGFSTHTQLNDYEIGRSKPLPHNRRIIAEFYGVSEHDLFERVLPVVEKPKETSRLRQKLATLTAAEFRQAMTRDEAAD